MLASYSFNGSTELLSLLRSLFLYHSLLVPSTESFLLPQIYINHFYFNNLWQPFHFKPLSFLSIWENWREDLANIVIAMKYESHWGKWIHTHTPHMHAGHEQSSFWTNLFYWPKLQLNTYTRKSFTIKAFSSLRMGSQGQEAQTSLWPVAGK